MYQRSYLVSNLNNYFINDFKNLNFSMYKLLMHFIFKRIYIKNNFEVQRPNLWYNSNLKIISKIFFLFRLIPAMILIINI